MDINIQAQPLNLNLPKMVLGEGPHWDAERQVLYCVDIIGQQVYRIDPATGEYEFSKVPSMIGFVMLEKSDHRLIVGLQDGIYRLDFITGDYQPVAKPCSIPSFNRFNDAKTDPAGRLWAGTMNLEPDANHPTGALYRLDENELVEIRNNLAISNGLGWTADGKHMFHTDTLREGIQIYDYDLATGTASNGQAFVKDTLGTGSHDGLAVDMEGRVFTAKWGGSSVEIYTPEGRLAGKIFVPAPHVTSCAFGGPEMKTLFITTARDGLSDAELKDAPLSGHIFTASMDVPGVTVPPCRRPL